MAQTADAERQAMLEKIRQDMAETRNRLREMREQKERRGTILQRPNLPAAGSTVKTEEAKSSFTQATSALDRLRAERALKKEASSGAVTDSAAGATPSATGGAKKVVIVRKKADGTEERIVKEVEVAADGSLVGTDGKLLPVRKVSVADNSEVSRLRKPSIDIGSARMSRILAPEGSVPKPSSAKLAESGGVKAAPRPRLGAGKNIRSLADLQKAIAKADRVKMQAQAQGKIDQLKRDRDERKRQMTREEKRAIRQSKRITMEFKNSESRVKVDQQIGQFMNMMQVLESEWQKGEEQRLKREEEWNSQNEMVERAAEQMNFLNKNLADISQRMERMNSSLEGLVDNAPKSVKKEEKWYGSDVKSWQENFREMRHQAFISSAKFKKMMVKTQESVEKLTAAAPPPPPPDGAPVIPGAPPPPSTSSTPSANPFSNLLSQIRQGTSLKKLDPDKIAEERKERKGNWRQSVQLLEGLQDTLRDALDQRHLALFSDSDSDEEDDDDWDD